MFEFGALRQQHSVYQTFIFAIFSFSILLFGHLTTASAQIYEYKYTPDLALPCDTPAGNGEFHVTGYPSIDLIFDEGQQKLDIQLDIEPCVVEVTGQEYSITPDGFWLVLDDGPNPKGTAGELAILYVDGDRLGGGKNPIATVYGYNGANGYESYLDGVANTGKYAQAGNQPPDYILTSHPSGGNAAWLEKFDVNVSGTQEISGVKLFAGKVSFHLVISTEDMNTHSPRYPDPDGGFWRGMQFGSQMGIWYHNMVGTTFEYCKDGDTDAPCAEPKNATPVATTALASSLSLASGGVSAQPALTFYPGFIKNLQFILAGWFDKSYEDTNQYPYCVTKFESTHPQSKNAKGEVCALLDVGESISAIVQGNDDDKGTLTLTYNGQPAGAMITPANGTTAPAPLSASFKYQTTLGDQGEEYYVNFLFTDEEGASRSCPLNLCVEKQQKPVCNIEITTPQPLQCAGTTTLVSFDATGSSDPDGDPLSYTFSTDCKNSAGMLETLTNTGAGTASVALTAPGEGHDVACTVSVSVSDGYYSQSCSAAVNVEKCELDCEGTPGGSKVPDSCGICGGDGTSCLDCEGTPNGGKVLDVCGLCGGDGTTCLDCEGTPNGSAVVNRCGICGGPEDDESCLGCSDVNISEVLVRLDSRSLHQLRLLQRIAKKWRQAGGPGAKIDSLVSQGEAIHSQNWTTVWSIPSVVTQCTNSTFCISVDNTVTVDTFTNGSNSLRALIRKVIIGYVKSAGRSKRLRKTLLRRSNKLHQENLTSAASVPAFSSSCS